MFAVLYVHLIAGKAMGRTVVLSEIASRMTQRRVRRKQLLDELTTELDLWRSSGTQDLRSFLGIPISGWVHFLSEGIDGQSDAALLKILQHIHDGRRNQSDSSSSS